MVISLVAQTLLGPGSGHIAGENPGNPLVWETLRQVSAATIHPLAVDSEGLDPQALEALLERVPVQLLILTPQSHFPTGVRLSGSRRARILELSREHRFPILELDPEYDFLLGAEGPPRPMAAGNLGQVLYAGSLSRLLAPGVRVSFLAVPSHLADPMARIRQRMDWQGDPMLEWALSELFLDGEIMRHLRKVRRGRLRNGEMLWKIPSPTRWVRICSSRRGLAPWPSGCVASGNMPVRRCSMDGSGPVASKG